MKKLFLSIMLFCLVLSSSTKINAQSTNIFDEIESNNMFSFANELIVPTGKTIISGSMQHNSTVDTVKDKEDWFKVTFESNGKCDFKFVNLTDIDKSNSYMYEHIEVFDEKLNAVKFFNSGLAHDEDETFYIRLSSSTYGSKSNGYYFDYQLILNDLDDYEYVSDKYRNPSNAYELTEGVETKFLGLGITNTKYFTIDVPKNKYLEIIVKASSDVDNKVLKPFEVSIFKGSLQNKVVDSYDVYDSMDFDSIVKNGVVKSYFKGEDTYLVAINGGEYFDDQANNQWGTIIYRLSDKPNDVNLPTIKGIKEGKVYNKAVTIKYSDASGIKSAKLNGKKFSSGKKVSKKGSYKVIVKDKAGNTRIVRFKIK